MKKLVILMLSIVILLPIGHAAAADTTKNIRISYAPIHYVVDGKEYTPPADQAGFIYTNDKNEAYTYVPLRFVASILNKNVGWDPKIFQVTVSGPKSEEWKTIREYLDTQEVKNSVIGPVDKSKITTVTINVSLTNVIYLLNGAQVQPDEKTPGFMYKDRLYVPLRFLYESLGFDPAWDQSTYSITTETEPKQLEYQTIVKAADKEIVALKTSCRNQLTGLVLQFAVNKDKMTDDEKAAVFEQGEAMLAECKVKFEALLDDLSAALTDAGQSADIATQYREAFDKEEAEFRAFVEAYK